MQFDNRRGSDDVRRLLVESLRGAERDRQSGGSAECTTRLNGKYVRFETRVGTVLAHISCSKMD